MSDRTSRRRVLGAVGTLVATVGCVGIPSGSQESPTTEVTTTDSSTTTTETDGSEGSDTTTNAEPSSDSDLDLREANVQDVTLAEKGDGYRFSVTLYHDDDGEDGYADWWQVETLEGDQLGRRTLLHAHGTQPFTRSTTVSIPDGVACVVVRGHDQTHGYGGQAMVVDLSSGDQTPVRQGPERRSIGAENCPGETG